MRCHFLLFVIIFYHFLSLFIFEVSFALVCDSSLPEIERLAKNVENILSDPNIQRINGCSPIERSVYNKSLSHITSRAKNILSEVEKVLNSTNEKSRLYSKMQSIKEVLECIPQKVPKIKMHCNKGCENGANMYINERRTVFVGFTVFKDVSDDLFMCTDTINRLKDIKKLNLESSIFHEISHMCGTVDLAYVRGVDTSDSSKWKLSSRSRVFEWHRNASHYQYWYLFGFCTPYKDCKAINF